MRWFLIFIATLTVAADAAAQSAPRQTQEDDYAYQRQAETIECMVNKPRY